MPEQWENRSTATDPGPAWSPGQRPDGGAVHHDLAGHPVDQTAEPRASKGCLHFAIQPHAAGTTHCARQTLADPTSTAPVILALIGGILIIAGALTHVGKGPGKLIKPDPRRRGATRRARRWQRGAGLTLIAIGLICLALIFI